ncbi:MAG: hypothetical protein WCA59_09685 [Candidatus Binataceae bacterium]
MTKLYCGNLVYEVGNQELRELFQSAGCEVFEAHIFFDDRNGHSRGFGAVKVPRESVAAALTLNEYEYRGRKLIVRPWTESARFTQPRWKTK